MMRLIGCIMLLGASTALGFGAANTLKERVRELESITHSIRAIELELSGKRAPLPELLRRAIDCTGGRIASLYNICESRLEHSDGITFSEIWTEAIKVSELHIKEEETLLLNEVGNLLGRYDADSQCSALKSAREQFTAFTEEAKEQYSRLGRVYSTLGVTAGAILMIVLI